MKLKFPKELINYNNYQNFILVFLYLSGFFSVFFNLLITGFDLVIIALVLAIVDIIFNLISRKVTYNKHSIQLLFIILIFFTWMVFSLTYSPSLEYKYEKTGNFLVSILLF